MKIFGLLIALDAIDKNILKSLIKNCRSSYKDLARANGISLNAIKRRIMKLVDTGVICQFKAALNWVMVDTHRFMALVQSERAYEDEEFAQKIGDHPLVFLVGVDSHGTGVVHGEFKDTAQLAELGQFLRTLEGVSSVHLHPLVTFPGEKIELTIIHLRILRQLKENARMTISEIAQTSGLTAKRIRKTLKEFLETKAVNFTVRLDLNAGEGTYVSFNLEWDPNTIAPNDVVSQIERKYGHEFWEIIRSASENVLWLDFVVDHMRDVKQIAKTLKKIPSVTVRSTAVPYPPKWFPSYRDARLEEMLHEAALL